MASYAQTQPTQFNPFVAPTDLNAQARRDQQELQAQVQVGTAKQSLYNDNAQKIQGLIDNVAGLQVARDVDKQYLNQALNGYKNDMQTIMKGDFSKQQVFNQAGSMAAKVYNDPKILSAVSSTKNYQDALGQLQEAHKNSKSSPTNDNFLTRNLNQYLQDQTVGATLGKQQYNDFFDYQKGFQDFMKDKHGNVTVEQNPYSNKTDGTPDWNAYALVDGKKVQISPLDVQNDARTYFSSNAQAANQLNIDSVYYSDKNDTGSAFQSYKASNTANLQSLTKQMEALQNDSKLNPTNSATNAAKIAQYQEAITKTQALNAKNEQAFLANPESAKMSLFQNQVLQGFGNRFAYTDLESKIIKNPIFEGEMDVEKLNLQKQKFDWDKESFKMNFDLEERKMQNTIKAAQISSGVAVGGQYDATKAEAYTPKDYQNDLKIAATEVTQNQLQTLYNTGAYNSIVTPGQDSRGNTIYRFNSGVTQKQFQEAWDQARTSYYNNPQGASRALKEYYDSSMGDQSGVGKERVYFAEAKRFNDINQQVEDKYKGDPQYQKYKQVEQNLGDPGTVFGYVDNKDGTKTPITRQDFIKYGQRSPDLPDKTKNAIDDIVNEQTNPGYSGNKDFKKEWGRVTDAIFENKDIYNKYSSDVNETFKNIAPNKSSIAVSEIINDKNANKLAALTTFASNQPDKASDFTKVTGEKGAGKITIGARKNPVSGQVTAFITNSKGTTAVIDIDNITAGQLEPSLMETDPYAGQQRILDANQGKYKGIKTTTGPNGLESYLPTQSNLKKYNMRYQIERSANGRGYAPIPEYSVNGTGTWIPLPYESKYFGSLAEANNWVNQVAAKGDDYLENTFLKQ